MIALEWTQVHAWRLAQHHLLERAERSDMLAVIEHIGGLHAQLMSAAELALWARVQDLQADDVQTALWQERTLIKTWAMRGTLHLLTVADFARHLAARSTLKVRRPPSYYQYHGVTPTELDAILTTVPGVLSEIPLTREALAEAVAQQTGNPNLRTGLLSGWGALLKPVAFRGGIGFGPNQGQNVTFVQPARWLGPWQPVDPQQAWAEIARRYFTVYGPATIEEFARWFGIEPGEARRTVRSLGDELVPVAVEGWPALMLATALPRLQTGVAPQVVRLLPFFDPYTVAVARHSDYLLPAAHKARVYRPQGWIAPVVLVDGRLAGVWESEKKRGQVDVQIELFTPRTATLHQGFEAEAERLAQFFGIPVAVTYTSS